MIAVDTSALIAILRLEPEADAYLEIMSSTEGRIISAMTLFETSMVLAGPRGQHADLRPLDDFLKRASIATVPFDFAQSIAARSAFLTYGKGRHPAALNFGDCASYALAQSRMVPLLYKGEDFAKTDVTPAYTVRE